MRPNVLGHSFQSAPLPVILMPMHSAGAEFSRRPAKIVKRLLRQLPTSPSRLRDHTHEASSIAGIDADADAGDDVAVRRRARKKLGRKSTESCRYAEEKHQQRLNSGSFVFLPRDNGANI
jgi:hypothetical protein